MFDPLPPLVQNPNTLDFIVLYMYLYMLSRESIMPIENPIDPDLLLIKLLIELNGLSVSKAAKLMGVQRSNLSAWLNGKPNVFSINKIEGMLEALGIRAMSDPSTGIRLSYLSPDIAHRWQVEKGAASLIDVFRSVEAEETLEALVIYDVNAFPKGHFNVVHAKRPNGELILLVANRDPKTRGYPLTPELLGFGKVAGTIEIMLETWIAWWKAEALPMDTFYKEISERMNKADKAGVGRHKSVSGIKSVGAELNECQRTVKGLRAVIQAFMDEMYKIDRENRLLDKGHRDKIFKDTYDWEEI